MKIDFQEIQETIQNLDPENIGSWPNYIKIAIFILVFIVVFIAGNYFFVASLQQDLKKEQLNESKNIKEFEQKSFKAANLEAFKKQMIELDGSYEALLRQLPQETEVPGLLEDITLTGLGSGLKFDSIDLGAEQDVEFYAVLPIDLVVRGGFHGLAGFVSGVAALPRIVTLHDFVIEAEQTEARSVGTKLRMTVNAKTYRYKNEE